MLKISVNYKEYKMPEKPGWLDAYRFPISSNLGFAKYRQDKSLLLLLEHPEHFLVKGNTFLIDGALLQRAEAAQFEILSWKYRVDEKSDILVDLSVKEIKPKLPEILFRKLTGDNQYFLVMIAIVLAFVTILIIYGLLRDFPNPLGFWEFVGRYIRGIIGWSLFILMFTALIWSQIKFSQSTIARTFWGAAFGILLWTLPFLWLILAARPPEIAGQPQEQILYLKYLQTHFISLCLILAGIVPWLTIFLKYFGWDLFASVLSKWAEETKK